MQFLQNLLPRDQDGKIDYTDPRLKTTAAVGTALLLTPVVLRKLFKSKIPSDRSRRNYNVLIIGGSRGVGLYLAKNFVLLGDSVIITSRSKSNADAAVKKLSELVVAEAAASSEGPAPNINNIDLGRNLTGLTCDITNDASIEALYKDCNKVFASQGEDNNNSGQIDIIINNAGIGYKRDYLWNVDSADVRNVIDVNLGSIIVCNQQAIQNYCRLNDVDFRSLRVTTEGDKEMDKITDDGLQTVVPVRKRGEGKPHSLHIFNMDGAGSNGRATARSLGYGASKAPCYHVAKTLNKEIGSFKDEIGGVKIHTSSPGMVMTELMLSYPVSNVTGENADKEPEPVLKGPSLKMVNVFNALVEEHDVVAKYLVEKVRGVKTNNLKAGQHVAWLTKAHAMRCIIGGILFGRNKNKFVDEKGVPNPKYVA